MLKILIADDHEVVRRGIKQILLEEFSFAYIDEAGDTDTLVSKAIATNWHIIVSDVTMPGGGGLDALRRIREQSPQIPILFVSIYPEEQYALRAIKAGASGYLNKDTAPEELVNAVHKVLSGKRYVTSEVEQQLSSSTTHPAEMPPHQLLSEREFNVFTLLIRGNSITEIADHLSIGVTTVSTYRSRILGKMNFRNNAELIQYALENNLI